MEDIRIVLSKERMSKALLELMGEKDYNRISIAELARRANVNRKTFYDHYQTVNDVYQEIMLTVIRHVFLVFQDYQFCSGSAENYRKTLVEFVRRVREVRETAVIFCSTSGPDCETQLMRDYLARNILSQPQEMEEEKMYSEAYEVFLEVQAGFMCGMIRSAVKLSEDHSDEEVVEAMLAGWGAFDIFMRDFSLYYSKNLDWRIHKEKP